jgi:receptor protein-tyrosine kinase
LKVPEGEESEGVADPRATQAFVRLKSLLSTGQLASCQVIVVTSPLPGDGKSFVSLNLARAFAESPETRTLLVEADLRRPTISTYLTPVPERGLADVLSGVTSLEHAVCRPTNSLIQVLPAARFAGEATTLLSSSDFERLMGELRRLFTRIVIDTPPITLFSDADVVSAHADGALLVVRSGATPSKMVERAIDMIHSAPVLGTVLNAASGSIADSLQENHRHGYYYEKYYPKKDR